MSHEDLHGGNGCPVPKKQHVGSNAIVILLDLDGVDSRQRVLDNLTTAMRDACSGAIAEERGTRATASEPLVHDVSDH